MGEGDGGALEGGLRALRPFHAPLSRAAPVYTWEGEGRERGKVTWDWEAEEEDFGTWESS